MKITTEIKLDNNTKSKYRFCYYAKRMKQNMEKFEVVICIENVGGFVNHKKVTYRELTEKEAEKTANSLNESIGMYDTKENMCIVLSTMKVVRRS